MKTKYCSLTVLSFLLVGISVFSGCKHTEVPPEVRPELTEPLILPKTLNQIDLEVSFSRAAPLSIREHLRDFMIIQDRLYAVSDRNYLMSLDAERAEPVYAWKLAPDAFKIFGLKIYDDTLYSIITTDLVVMDPKEGIRKISKRLGFGPICSPVRNSSFFYVAGTDQRIHALRASDLVQVFAASANDNTDITCVTADENVVIFVTAAGTMIAMLADEPVQLWKFNTQSTINEPIVRNSEQVIFSGKDANVYVIDERSGKLIWKYLTSALLTEAPVVTQRYVYQRVNGKGLLAIDRASGKLAWKVPNGVAMLSENGRKVYVMTSDRSLVVMDTKKMKKVGQVELPQVDRWISNVSDEKIYLADKFGRIICIKPKEY